MKLKLQPDMRDYTPRLRLYWWAVTVIGAGVIAYVLLQVARLPLDSIAIALAGAAVAALVGYFPVRVPGIKGALACADLFIVLVMLTVGVAGGVLASVAESTIAVSRNSKRWTSRIMTPTQNAAIVFASGMAMESVLSRLEHTWSRPAAVLAAVMVFSALYYLLSIAQVETFYAVKNGTRLRYLSWWRKHYIIALWFVASSAVAALIYLALEQFGWITLLVSLPVVTMFLATYYALDRNAEMSRRKSEFLAHMSHELRTPLNAIIGGSQILKDGVLGPMPPRQQQWMQDIHESGEHLLGVINDILDISKIEAGRMELARTRVDVAGVVAGAITLVKDAAARRGIWLSSDVASDAGTIEADERKLKQVLLNLLSNAIKFTPDGGSVSVTAHRDAHAVRIAVRDTGIGIAQEDQKVVFDAFRQVGDDAAAKAMGTGLGLTLARDLVALHGGTLGLESEPGRGSVFTIQLPA